MSQKITKRVVDQLTDGQTFWDATLKGFGVRRSGDVIAYFVKYRIGGGRAARQRMLTIGRHGAPWTSDTARELARKWLHEARLGQDPAEARKPTDKSMTVAELCNAYLDGIDVRILPGKGRPKKPRTIEADRSNIERHIKPLLGKKRINQLTTKDIERFQQDIAAGKTTLVEKTKPRGVARVRGGKGIAARTTSLLAAILGWAVKERLLDSNPAKGVTLFKTKQITRYLTDEEAQRLGDAIAAAEQEWIDWTAACDQARAKGHPQPPRRGESPVAIAALKALLLTGSRKMEILSLRRDWVDPSLGVLLLPDSKTGKKTIHVAEPVIEILESTPKIEGEQFVFPGKAKDSHFKGLSRVWSRIRQRAGLVDVRLHDLRHHFATVATSAGINLQAIGRMLGHADLRSTRKYAHIPDDPLRRTTEENAARIAAQLKGTKSLS